MTTLPDLIAKAKLIAAADKDLMESTRISCQYLEGRGTLVEALAKLEAKLRENLK
jgi:hypothetical protein